MCKARVDGLRTSRSSRQTRRRLRRSSAIADERVSIGRHRVVMTSRRCDVLRGSWCAAARELALGLLSCTPMSFQAGGDGSITRLGWTAVCYGMELAGVSRACRSSCWYILTDAAFCACSVVWRVYHERSDRRSQEQRNAARVRDHPVHGSISSPPVPSPELRARAEPPLASRVHHSLRPTFSTRRLQHRRNPARG